MNSVEHIHSEFSRLTIIYNDIINSSKLPPGKKLEPIIENESDKKKLKILPLNISFVPTIMTQYITYKGNINNNAFAFLPVIGKNNYERELSKNDGIIISTSKGKFTRGIGRNEKSKSFKNSCMLCVKSKNLESDIKFFMGVIHICGCKNRQDSQEIFTIIINKIIDTQKIFDTIYLGGDLAIKITNIILEDIKGDELEEIKKIKDVSKEKEPDDSSHKMFGVNPLNIGKIKNISRDLIYEKYKDNSSDKFLDDLIENWDKAIEYFFIFSEEILTYDEYCKFISCILSKVELIDENFGDFVRYVPMLNHNYKTLVRINRAKLVEEVQKYPHFFVSFFNLVFSHVTIRIPMKYINEELKRADQMTEKELEEIKNYFKTPNNKMPKKYDYQYTYETPKPRATLLVNSTRITQSNPGNDSAEIVYKKFMTLFNEIGPKIAFVSLY